MKVVLLVTLNHFVSCTGMQSGCTQEVYSAKFLQDKHIDACCKQRTRPNNNPTFTRGFELYKQYCTVRRKGRICTLARNSNPSVEADQHIFRIYHNHRHPARHISDHAEPVQPPDKQMKLPQLKKPDCFWRLQQPLTKLVLQRPPFNGEEVEDSQSAILVSSIDPAICLHSIVECRTLIAVQI